MRLLSFALFLILSVFLILEILLRLFDPWGIYLYEDYERLHEWYEADPFGAYWLPPGEYEMTRRRFRILDDHTRFLPATNPNAACQIVFIGDSFTFGHDVADEAIWANLIAGDFPDVHFLNAGNVGYTSEHVRASMARFPEADGFIYFVVGNDMDASSPLDPRQAYPNVHYWLYYYEYARWHRIRSAAKYPIPPSDEARFWDDLAFILAQEPILVFGYDEDIMPQVQARYPQVLRIVEYTETVSALDFHPNAQGHAFIAEQIRPAIAVFIAETC